MIEFEATVWTNVGEKLNERKMQNQIGPDLKKKPSCIAQLEADFEVEHQQARARLKKQIAGLHEIYAPLDGQVVYANIKDGRASEQVVIDEGVLVRERQAIINIPDLDIR